VIPEAMLLKPSMVMPGLDAVIHEDSVAHVATHTARVLRRTVPPAIPGIHFLSGGMGAQEATLSLQQLNRVYPDAPWAISFSFGRALQDAPLKAWAGRADRVAAAQALLLELARVNAQASIGEWDEVHPTPASGGLSSGRILLPKLSFSRERKMPAAELFNW
jgi:fructose-bisphosphate aldolase class I